LLTFQLDLLYIKLIHSVTEVIPWTGKKLRQF